MMNGINGQSFRVVRILVACEATVHRLPQQAYQLMLRVLAASQIAKDFLRYRRQPQRFIEFAIGDQARITGNGSAVKL